MGDSYDEDEGRLMIDDAILDSSHSSQIASGSAETTVKMTSYEKTVELTPTSEDGVESHPVDPEPKPNFYFEGGVSKVVQGAHRDDRLKMTIRRTQSPVGSGGQYTYLGEKRADGAARGDDISKEEGEIDDEEETGNSESTTLSVHKPTNWSGYQSVVFEAASTAASKFRHAAAQQFEHHPSHITSHCGTRQLAVNISNAATVTASSPLNATSSVTADEHTSRFLSAPHPPKTQTSPVSARIGAFGSLTSPTEDQLGEESANLDRPNADAEADVLENAGILSSKARKKKRRASERDEREACQASSSGTSVFSASSASQVAVAYGGVSAAKKKKLNIRDRSTCVSVKSVQTNDNDLDVKIGSSHCLNISVLAKASNYLYFVTNWNGHELYGVMGDGLPPLQQTYMSKKNGGSSAALNNVQGADLFSSHDKINGGSPSKQRPNAKRPNRSSSVCPPNGFPENKSTGRKGLIGAGGRPSSASTSDVQSVGGDLQDDERSHSPVSWFTSGSNDPISALGAFGSTIASDSSYLRECIASTMYSCPVAGCEHRYDTQSQLAIHYHTHFVKEDGGRAIYVETMGSQTDVIVMKDAAVDPVNELVQNCGAEIAAGVKTSKSVEKTPHLMSPKPKLLKTLTNHEEQSISELFKVVAQKTETSCGAVKADDKKIFATKCPRISAGSDKTYGSLLGDGDMGNVKEMPTALDAMRKMVTDSGNEAGSLREQQSGTVISSSGSVPSTRSSITSATAHGGTTSPAFSDISDDAPTLEKQVAEKSEEGSLDRIKELVNCTEKAPLGQLSLSIESEKVSSVSKSGSSNLLCPVSASTTTTVTTMTVPRVSAGTNQSSTSDGTKKSETKSQTQANTIGSFGSPFMDPSSFTGIRHPSTIPISMPNLSNAATASVFAPPYFMPFINPSASNTTTAVLSQPPTSKHKIHDLKNNPPSLISSQTKESGNIGQASSIVASPSSRPVSQGGSGNMQAAKQAVHQQSGSQNVSSGSSFTGVQPHTSGNCDRSASTQSAQSSALNFMQQQQQQAYFAQLQQHQQMQYMQRFGAAFPMSGTPNSMNAVAQQAYEQQMAALHASFGFPGIFMPPSFPPK